MTDRRDLALVVGLGALHGVCLLLLLDTGSQVAALVDLLVPCTVLWVGHLRRWQ